MWEKPNSQFLSFFFVSVGDDFTLSDTVMTPHVNGEEWALQLLDKTHDGKITLQYFGAIQCATFMWDIGTYKFFALTMCRIISRVGTALDIPVVPALASELSVHMKEKPKMDLSKVILTPMPGVVTSVEVEVGDMVGVGQGKSTVHTYSIGICANQPSLFPSLSAVCYVEAMKMKNAMSPTVVGKVKRVNVEAGQSVEEDTVLIELE